MAPSLWGVVLDDTQHMNGHIVQTFVAFAIRDFPYYATFREKGAKLACADKLGVFLSLTLCKKASFECLAFIK